MLLTVTNTADFLAAEDSILVEVSKATSLLNQGGGKAVRVGLVVNELSVHIVIDLGKVVTRNRSTFMARMTYIPLS